MAAEVPIDPALLGGDVQRSEARSKSPLDILAEAASEAAFESSLEAAPASHVLPEDSGIIRCVCPFDDDDGFTIQCDGCFAWQHAMCVNIDADDVPERYLCHLCDPRPLNVEMATTRQQRRLMGEDSRTLINEAAEQRSQEAERQEMTEEENWEGEPNSGSPAPGPVSRKSSASPIVQLAAHGKRRSMGGAADEAVPSPPAAKRKRSNKSQDLRPEATPPVRRRESRMQTVITTTTLMTFERPDVFNDKIAWKREYTPSDTCIWSDQTAVQAAASACEVGESEDRIVVGTITPLGKASFKRRRRRAVDPPRAIAKLPFNSVTMTPGYEEATAAIAGPIASVKMNAMLPATPLEVKPIPSTMPAVLAPLSVAPFAGPMTGQQPSLAIPFPRAPMYGVLLTANVELGDFIAECTGEIVPLAALAKDRSAQYASMGVWKPFIRALPYPWSLAIDARRYGNETRFIRTSCHPNVVVRPIVIKGRNGDLDIHFGVFALFDLQKDEELILGWDWDDVHVIHLLPKLFDLPSPSPQPALSDTIDVVELSESIADIITTLLGVTSCACDKRKDCAVGWLYKLAQVSQTTPKGGMSREESFELTVATATGGLESAGKKGTGKRSAKLPELGPFVGLRRLWEPPLPRKRANLPKKKEHVSLVRPDKQPPSPKKAIAPPAIEPTSLQVEAPPAKALVELFNQEIKASIPAVIVPIEERPPAPEQLAAGTMEVDVKSEEQPILKIEDAPAEIAKDIFAAPAEPEAAQAEPIVEPPPVEKPSPPKAKLSLAAYRQRMMEKKAEEEAARQAEEEAAAKKAEEDAARKAEEATRVFVETPTEIDAPVLPLSGEPEGTTDTRDSSVAADSSAAPDFVALDSSDESPMLEPSDTNDSKGEMEVDGLRAAPLPSPALPVASLPGSNGPGTRYSSSQTASYFPSMASKTGNSYAAVHSPSPEPEYHRRQPSRSMQQREASPIVVSDSPASPRRTASPPRTMMHPDRMERNMQPVVSEQQRRGSFEHQRMPSVPSYGSSGPYGRNDWPQQQMTPPREPVFAASQEVSPPTGPRADRSVSARGRGEPAALPSGPRGGSGWPRGRGNAFSGQYHASAAPARGYEMPPRSQYEAAYGTTSSQQQIPPYVAPGRPYDQRGPGFDNAPSQHHHGAHENFRGGPPQGWRGRGFGARVRGAFSRGRGSYQQ